MMGFKKFQRREKELNMIPNYDALQRQVMSEFWRDFGVTNENQIKGLCIMGNRKMVYRKPQRLNTRLQQLQQLFPNSKIHKVIGRVPDLFSDYNWYQYCRDRRRELEYLFPNYPADKLVTREPRFLTRKIEYIEQNLHFLVEHLGANHAEVMKTLLQERPFILVRDVRDHARLRLKLVMEYNGEDSEEATRVDLQYNPQLLTKHWGVMGRLLLAERERFYAGSVVRMHPHMFEGFYPSYRDWMLKRLVEEGKCDKSELLELTLEDLELVHGELVRIQKTPRYNLLDRVNRRIQRKSQSTVSAPAPIAEEDLPSLKRPGEETKKSVEDEMAERLRDLEDSFQINDVFSDDEDDK